jgi:hypothetical protein
MPGGADLEYEARFVIGGVADQVQSATRDVEAIAGSQLVHLSPHAGAEETGDHLDPLVLAKVHMPRHPTTCIQTNLYLEQITPGLSTGLQEGQVLAGDRIVQVTPTHGVSLSEICRTCPRIHEGSVTWPRSNRAQWISSLAGSVPRGQCGDSHHAGDRPSRCGHDRLRPRSVEEGALGAMACRTIGVDYDLGGELLEDIHIAAGRSVPAGRILVHSGVLGVSVFQVAPLPLIDGLFESSILGVCVIPHLRVDVKGRLPLPRLSRVFTFLASSHDVLPSGMGRCGHRLAGTA